VLEIDGISSLGPGGIPLVYLNQGVSGQPILKVNAPQFTGTLAQIYGVASGTQPIVNINTMLVHQNTVVGNDILAYSGTGGGAGNYLQGSAVARLGSASNLGFYQWSGVSTTWNAFQLQMSAFGDQLNFCPNVSGFAVTSYAALGTETVNCTASVNNGVWNGTGYSLNGTPFISGNTAGFHGGTTSPAFVQYFNGLSPTGDLGKFSSDGSLVDAGGINSPGTGQLNLSTEISVGGGVQILNTSAVPQVGTPTAGQAACIKLAGPPVIIGYCSTVVSSSGSCTCN